MPERPVLVLTATGGQGRAVTEALLARGATVRALVRDAARPAAQELAGRGVEVVTGVLEDPGPLADAMRGVAGVFALTTPFESGPAAEIAQGRAILAAAREAAVPHLVFSSVAGALDHSGVPHFDSKAVVEADVRASGVPFTILGPTYFYDNALGGTDRILAGFLDLPLPGDRPLQQLARTDHGAFAADALLDPDRYLGHRIELASDSVTPTEMAAALSDVLGQEVRHNPVPLAAVTNEDMHAMWTFLTDPGYQVDIPALHAAHPDIAWTGFAAWARQTFTPGR
ncbi:NmrA/HSCARG family protein [Amycolatopsis sp. FDAARGOS 1241]|uniref:NmrA/HSCARG family protein n=1 Tax=Amycolatopsis sp. FDAARGOS 1241 TaxID=2778070 RepID=UPI0019518F50|nr:NmrA/HSCARG family protein [Amycolatopsis sp. FDAARGOS 1241]QRP43111.1 NmrA/HSCARG family protein [Amycolatopsis sp. FDAARGOS 1241]